MGEKSIEFELKTGCQGHVYFPKKNRRVFGDKLRLLPDSNVAVIFPENADPEAIFKSLRVMISDLKLRIETRRPEGAS
jgi:hypothetical protein